LGYIQGGRYHANLPTWHNRDGEDAYFTDQYFVFERKVLDDVLTLANAPNYLRQMRDDGFRFRANGMEYVVVSRFSSTAGATAMDLVNFIKRKKKSTSQTRREPIILWESYSNNYEKKTLVSEIWQSCFGKLFIPYNRDKRLQCLRKDSPVSSSSC
jgi:hypothetical protein